jgi:hypothetical protein
MKPDNEEALAHCGLLRNGKNNTSIKIQFLLHREHRLSPLQKLSFTALHKNELTASCKLHKKQKTTLSSAGALSMLFYIPCNVAQQLQFLFSGKYVGSFHISQISVVSAFLLSTVDCKTVAVWETQT